MVLLPLLSLIHPVTSSQTTIELLSMVKSVKLVRSVSTNQANCFWGGDLRRGIPTLRDITRCSHPAKNFHDSETSQKLVMSSSLLPESGGKRDSNGSGSEKGKLIALLYDNQRLIASEQTSRPWGLLSWSLIALASSCAPPTSNLFCFTYSAASCIRIA